MCGCAGGGSSVGAPSQRQAIVPYVPDPNCQYSSGILTVWLRIIKCVKDSGSLSLIGLTDYQANIHIGNIQSAINYPEDYCFFSPQLADFQQNILPRIIENVPTCL